MKVFRGFGREPGRQSRQPPGLVHRFTCEARVHRGAHLVDAVTGNGRAAFLYDDIHRRRDLGGDPFFVQHLMADHDR